MELGSKVTALEEEVAVLKGEIKMILQEVRTAVLARENPFAVDTYDPAPALVPQPVHAAEPETPPRVIQLNSPPDPEPETAQPTTAPRSIGAVETDAARRPAPIAPGRQTPLERRRIGHTHGLDPGHHLSHGRERPGHRPLHGALRRSHRSRTGDNADQVGRTALCTAAREAPHRCQRLPAGAARASALIEDAEDNYGSASSRRRAS